MQKIILYYIFTPVIDPEALRLWQLSLCNSLDLKGRIILSPHGINGTLGGDTDKLKKYISETKTYPNFKKIEFKWGDGSVEDFPRLSVKVREEIVTFEAKDEIKVNRNGLIGGGKKLKPSQVHKLIEESNDDDVVFFDGRNAYEASVGKFKDAVVTDARYTRDFKTEIEKPKYDSLKNKKVITYCTGGIRCEVLSVLMKNRGFKDVYQIDGGIVKYGKEFGDNGYWEGSLYVFDKRMNVKFSNKAVDIGACIYCAGPTSRYINCAVKSCNDLILVCDNCDQETFCKRDCKKLSKVPTA